MNKPVDLPIASIDPDDIGHNRTANPSFRSVLDARLSRRSMLRGGVGSAATVLFSGLGLSACGGGGDSPVATALAEQAQGSSEKIGALGFGAVGKSLADVVVVPAGYTASILYALGDPLDLATPEYRNDGTDLDFHRRAGDHHDGIEYFGLSADGSQRDAKGSARGCLVMNHEALTDNFLHAAGSSERPRPASQADKEIPAHGVSVVEVQMTGSGFATVRDSAYNRRITPLTELRLSGPARGSDLLKSCFCHEGIRARGTINNCGTGYTPWGSYLTAEENWAGYFTRGTDDDAARGNDKSVVSLNRYGRAQGAASRHGWETSGSEDKYRRWNISQTGASAGDDYRNELNTFGWIVEIDPYDKTATIKKRTALGRFAHESAACSHKVEGRPLALYMGDDSRGEYIYKFVSAATWSAADADAADRIATGDKYLDDGKLYVAKFNADGSGDWIELSISNPAIAGYATYPFADQADVLINTRLAADAVGATKMDRPEWCSVHPTSGEIYYTLTNNSNRKVEPASSSQAMVDAANPRSYSDSYNGEPAGSAGNVNGHIIRLAESGSSCTATKFSWDVYLFGAQWDADPALVNLSSLTTDQDFSSPDSLWFSPSTGVCWIQTDDGAYTDVTNCMMLAGVPGQVGDGATATLSYAKADGSTLAVDTYVGKTPSADALKRFLVGPVDCEITGITETPDGKAIFVNIQHPGETIAGADVGDPSKYLSHWPGNAGYGAGGANARPRSATIVITKDDGGRIGT